MTLKSANGIPVVLLLENPNLDRVVLLDLVDRATAVYEGFDFKKNVESIIFYRDREEASTHILETYDLQDSYSEETIGTHFDYEDRSVIVVELNKGRTKRTLIHELGHAVEYQRLLQSTDNFDEWWYRRGYNLWSEFFCETNASAHQTSRVGFDNYLLSFSPRLARIPGRLPKRMNQYTFYHLVFTMSDLYYLQHTNNQKRIEKHMNRYRKEADDRFMKIYQSLYEELVEYLHKTGANYEQEHDFSFFERLEVYEEQFSDYFAPRYK